jgi:ElaB/YqjD/DUF883 family membrane-anchored ribosome-binding protein
MSMVSNTNDRDSDFTPNSAEKGAFTKEVGSLHSTAPGDAFRRENPDDFLQTGALPNDEVLQVTVVARAVDDGMIYASESTWTEENKSSNAHKLSDSIRRIEDSVSNRVDRISQTVRSNVQAVKEDVSSKALSVKDNVTSKVSHVSDEIKQGVATADQKVKANPYLFAAAAVGVGFLLGRVFLSQKTAKAEKVIRNYPDYQNGSNLHTGIHVREENRYATR